MKLATRNCRKNSSKRHGKRKLSRRLGYARRRKKMFTGCDSFLAIVPESAFRTLVRLCGFKNLGLSGKSIAVLPLENLSEEKDNAYFADGIQDELLSNLAKIKDLKVIGRTSVMRYKSGITRNLKEIAQQLGVSKVVEGSVRRSGNHIRVSVQLIDALTDRHIGRKTTTGRWPIRSLCKASWPVRLRPRLARRKSAGEGASGSSPTKNTAAYDAYLRGRAFAGGSTTDFSNIESAVRSYQEAVKLDPSFVLAWAYFPRRRA